MKIIIVSVVILIILSCSINRTDFIKQQTIVQERSNDTIVFSDTTYQILQWKNNKLESIRLVSRKPREGKFVHFQYIEFYPNGVVREISIRNNGRWEVRANEEVFAVQENMTSFSETGDVLKNKIMKDHKIVSSYESK